MIGEIITILLHVFGLTMFIYSIWWSFNDSSTSVGIVRDQDYNERLDEIDSDTYYDSYMDCGE